MLKKILWWVQWCLLCPLNWRTVEFMLQKSSHFSLPPSPHLKEIGNGLILHINTLLVSKSK